MPPVSSPGNRRRAPLLAAALFLLSAAATSARQEMVVPVDEHVPVVIKISTAFDVLPPSGCASVDVLIDNGTGSRGVWAVRFRQSLGYMTFRDTWVTEASCAVEAHSQRTFPVLVPLASPASKSDLLIVSVDGPGVGGTTQILRVGETPSGAPRPDFAGVSDGLTLDINRFPKLKSQENLARFAAADLPQDWRALSGFDALWLPATELAPLTAPQRTALQDWVAMGGALHLFGATERPAGFALEGLGSVTMHSAWQADSPEMLLVATKPPRTDWFSPGEVTSWEALQQIGPVRPNLPVLTTLLLALAVTIGPINLYVFAGQGRRARLLWTTPLISLGASLALGLMIFLQDGLGGRGIRHALVVLLPGQSKAAVWQEQVSRTGVLFGSAFHLANPSVLRPIAPEVVGSKDEHTFASRGQDYSGSWFSNRARQGCFIQTVIPTRGEVQLLNPEALTNGQTAPTVVSSIDVPLEEIYVRTADSELWHGRQLRAGQRQTLSPMGKGDVPQLLPAALLELRRGLSSLPHGPGSFLAVTSDARAFQETLPAIHWQEQRAVYAGQVIPAK